MLPDGRCAVTKPKKNSFWCSFNLLYLYLLSSITSLILRRARMVSLQWDLIYNVGGTINTLTQTGTSSALVLLVNVTRPSLQYGKGLLSGLLDNAQALGMRRLPAFKGNRDNGR